ncbi:MAG TPA: sugar phosphate isomerase/epimerase [Clostridia bacterium]|nr:sugar phosphate isomerase/epimerase [Clostridia bacterium]
MKSFPIGVMLESFRLPIEEALGKARDLKVQGIQVYATTGELAPDRLSAAQRKEFLKKVRDHGLVVSAVCGDLGHGFGDAQKNPGLVESSKSILDLSLEWESGIVTTHIGVVPEDRNHPRYRVMQDACGELARYADSAGAKFAVETGPETAANLKAFLDSLRSRGVSVNLDPANLVMVTGDDPVAAVHTLKDYIVHTHAKDGKNLYYREPEKVYGIVFTEKLESPSFEEVPLGEGGVDFPAYLDALREIGYKGFLTIEREVGEQPEEDIGKAVTFLRKLFV